MEEEEGGCCVVVVVVMGREREKDHTKRTDGRTDGRTETKFLPHSFIPGEERIWLVVVFFGGGHFYRLQKNLET